MVWTDDLTFGTCRCGARLETRRIQVEPAGVTDAAQGACPVCGVRVYRPMQLLLLERGLRDEDFTPGELGEA